MKEELKNILLAGCFALGFSVFTAVFCDHIVSSFEGFILLLLIEIDLKISKITG